MRIALVIGSAVSTIKDETLHGRKLLLVQPANPKGVASGEPFIAVDTVSAGKGDLVLVTEYSSARYTGFTKNLPIDAVIVGVIDSLEQGGKYTYQKQ